MEPTNNDPRSRVTRQDRAITDDAWIAAFLQRAPMAALATVQSEQPFISTLLFALDESQKAIYFHTPRRGRVWENLKENPRICLTAAEMGRLLPAKTALNFSVEYESVVVFGSARLVDDPTDAERALQLILDRYFPHLHSGQDYRPIMPDELSATAVFCMSVEAWSGKRKAVPEDFPGAFRWNS